MRDTEGKTDILSSLHLALESRVRGYNRGGACRPGPLHPTLIQVGPACCARSPGPTHRSPAGLPKASVHGHSSTLAWKVPWLEEPGGLQSMVSLRVGHEVSDFTFPFHFHALEKEMATHSSILAWRIPGTGEPGGLPSMGSHRVRHD